MTPKEAINILKDLIKANVRVIPVEKHHGHFLLDVDGTPYYVIFTRRTLRRPRAIGINYDGEMIGINRLALMKAINTFEARSIVFLYFNGKSLEILTADPKEILYYVDINDTCRKMGFETICHYPKAKLKLIKVVPKSESLMKFMD